MERFFVGLQVTLLGMLTVLVILLLLYLAMLFLRRVAGPEPEKAKDQGLKKPLPAEEKSPLPVDGGDRKQNPKVIAAITAAVLAACDADARRPRALRLSQGGGKQWKSQGRGRALRT